jgi:FSR family fosmidomycin resistance protein-like MFS transporter
MSDISESPAAELNEPATPPLSAPAIMGTTMTVLFAICVCHLLNDMMQSVLSAIYPNLKETLDLSFTQIGLVTLTFQVTASLLQPLVGLYSDKHPMPYSLPIAMVCTLFGLLLLAVSHSYVLLLVAAALVGLGSSVFHPESSRVARMAAGGRHGFAQSMFQVGGNVGSALGPLAAAAIVAAEGQTSVAWFALMALAAILILWRVGTWYKEHGLARMKHSVKTYPAPPFSRATRIKAIVILMILTFSKQVYISCVASYHTFFVIDKFGVSVQAAQVYLFLFLIGAAIGTVSGGIIGDRIGRKKVIWVSILGCMPFALALPYVSLFWMAVLSFIVGTILSAAFPAILVYAQELAPHKIGMISGLFFGFAFGLGGLGAAVLGWLADKTSIQTVYIVCSFLPLLGLFTGFLPDIEPHKAKT